MYIVLSPMSLINKMHILSQLKQQTVCRLLVHWCNSSHNCPALEIVTGLHINVMIGFYYNLYTVTLMVKDVEPNIVCGHAEGRETE